MACDNSDTKREHVLTPETPISLTDLQAAIADLEARFLLAEVRGEHLVPDLVLMGFAREVHEHARATSILLQTSVPRTAFACLRSAWEATIDLLFLTTREGEEYDRQGARAYAGELLDHEKGRESAEAPGLGHLPPGPSADEVARDAARAWDVMGHDSQGRFLEEAMAQVRAERKRGRFPHWSGHRSRSDLPTQFGPMTGGVAETPLIYKAIYSRLSIQVHPAPRLDGRMVRIVEGESVIEYLDPTAETLAGDAPALGYLAVVAAMLGIRRLVPGDDRAAEDGGDE